ncbi:MAG: LuxR C-terminal-related transcriptional regulator [Pseudomonadota bacterium]
MQTDIEVAFDAAPIGIVLTEDRIIRTCNTTFCTLTGFEKVALIGQSFRMLYASDAEFRRVRDIGLAQLKAGQDYSDMRLLRRADGSALWCRFRAQTLDISAPLARTVLTYAKVHAPTHEPALTARERDVVLGLRTGKTSKQIAFDLSLSVRTIEGVRARLLKKFKSRNLPEMLSKFTNLER